MIRAIIFDCFGVVVADSLAVMCRELLPDNPDAVSRIWAYVDRANRGLIKSEESTAHIAEIFGMHYDEYVKSFPPEN